MASCKICGKKFSTQQGLTRHEKRKYPCKNDSCLLCDTSFHNMSKKQIANHKYNCRKRNEIQQLRMNETTKSPKKDITNQVYYDSSYEYGIIYLVTPAELIGLHRFKVGFSKNMSLQRVKTGYKNGSIWHFIMRCRHPKMIEAELLIRMRETFTLIAGNEYFEGDILNAIELCFEHVRKSYKL